VLRSDKAVGSDTTSSCERRSPGRRIILYDYIASRTTAALKQLFVGRREPTKAVHQRWVERYDDIATELKLLHCVACSTAPMSSRRARSVNCPQPHAGECGMVDYIRPVYQVEEQIKGRGKSLRRAGKICLWKRSCAAPGEVQAHPGEVQGLGR